MNSFAHKVYYLPNLSNNVVLFKNGVTSSDRFVQYQCKKAYTTFLRNQKASTDHVMGILLDEKQLEHHACCLEICAEILSKQCEYCQHYAEEISSKLYQYSHTFFNIQQNLDSQCTFCLLKVYCKYIKLVQLFDSKSALGFIQTLLTDFTNRLIDILFKSEFPWYVTRQIIRLLSSVLKLKICTLNDHIASEIIKLNAVLVDRLLDADLETILYSPRTGGFSGQECVTDQCDSSVDVVHIMEWSYLIILTASFHTDTESSKQTDLLIKLDSVLKQKLGQDNDILLSWLPEIFSHQDDMWIDVLHWLMSPRLSCSSDKSASIQNHWYFLHFINAMGYDHLILVDFLTSPETNFLAYLVSYLKYLISSWTEFTQVVETIQRTQKISTLQNTCTFKDQIDINPKLISFENGKYHHEMISIEREENKSMNENSIKEILIDRKIPHLKAGEMIKTEKLESPNVVTKMLPCDKVNELKICIKSEKTTTKLSKSGGLGLINEMYNDSASGSDDNEAECNDIIVDAEVRVNQANSVDTDADLVRNYSTSNMKTVAHSSVDQNTFSRRPHSHNYSFNKAVVTRFGSPNENITDKRIPHNTDCKEMDLDLCSANSIQEISTLNKEVLNDCTVLGLDNEQREEKGDTYFDKVDRDADVNDNENDNNNNTDLNVDDDYENDDDDTNVLDLVMAALIRVRLKLERVWDSGVISYNPKPLITLLHYVEDMFES